VQAPPCSLQSHQHSRFELLIRGSTCGAEGGSDGGAEGRGSDGGAEGGFGWSEAIPLKYS